LAAGPLAGLSPKSGLMAITLSPQTLSNAGQSQYGADAGHRIAGAYEHRVLLSRSSRKAGLAQPFPCGEVMPLTSCFPLRSTQKSESASARRVEIMVETASSLMGTTFCSTPKDFARASVAWLRVAPGAEARTGIYAPLDPCRLSEASPGSPGLLKSHGSGSVAPDAHHLFSSIISAGYRLQNPDPGRCSCLRPIGLPRC